MSPAASPIVSALPFWLSLLLVPLAVIEAAFGGWTVLLMPFYAWWLFSLLDAIAGLGSDNPDIDTPDRALFWHRAVTLIWFPLQFGLVFGLIRYATQAHHLSGWELGGLFFGVGIVSGTIGINYAHELMHRKSAAERLLADLLLGMVLYSHFRSEHLRVHHPYVGTPRDLVTARYDEGFYRFFPRVLFHGPQSAWTAEAAMLARRGLPPMHRDNPFWRYGALQFGFLALAYLLGGWLGVLLFVFQAFIAVWQLELVNYIEHYGLTRRHLGEGHYEHVKPHHAWNATHRATNWLLINLQRHSDHHAKPDRPFPLLQTYPEDQAPHLPYGYPIMTAIAMIPPFWRRKMNARVKDWRKRYYPDITDWSPYDWARNPMPRGASGSR
jgi:alkane 1-monooxygenase